jgi:hypothetical protein
MINVSDKITGEVYAKFNTATETKGWIDKNCDFDRTNENIFMWKCFYYGNEIEIWMN